MIRFLFRKIRLYPAFSSFASLLVCSIVTFEAGILFPELRFPGPSYETAPTTPVTTSIPVAGNEETAISADTPSESGPIAAEIETGSRIEAKLELATRESIKGIDPVLANMLAAGQFDELREALLDLAATAVTENDKKRLGYILNLLGQVSIQDQDIYSAEVYLREALDIFRGLEDDIGIAQVNLQLGRTHLKSRQIARIAGTAYDELQVGRWYIANNMPSEAEQYIHSSIERNLSINRFGSAAAAYESLAKMYLSERNFDQAVVSAFESARMFASSGRIERASQVVSLIPEGQAADWQLTALREELETNQRHYKEGILQIERARDYRRLYYYYRNQGDQERAWKFRLLASKSLGEVPKRTLFHRQQGVLAILYNSNDDMDKAEEYLTSALDTFDSNGLTDLSEETSALTSQIF